MFIPTHRLPDAIIARNDLQALGVISALRDANVRVPEDVAVVGFDNIEYAEFAAPKLTTIGMDPGKLAGMLTDTLFKRSDGELKGAPIRLEIDAELHVRESCGSVARSQTTVAL
jgi:DNA-binding LacI/PurR family transcriptional regulator